jgi:probable HAF family extracellular repeat protein
VTVNLCSEKGFAMTRLPSWTGLLLATLGLVFLPTVSKQTQHAQTAPGPYTLTDLGSLGGGDTQAFDLNDSAQVVGYSRTASLQSRAFLWDDSQMVNLGVVNADDFQSAAVDLNVLGHAVGTSTLKNGLARAALWRNGSIIGLTPELPPYEGTSFASAINDHGHIVGAIDDDSSLVYDGILWANGSRTALGSLGGGSTRPADINNAGQVVGTSNTSVELGQPHAFLWQNGVMTDLGLLRGDDQDSGAAAINADGVIVGTSGRLDENTGVDYRPFVWENGVMSAIPTPSSEAYATDINDAGVVVGLMRTSGAASPYHAWIYVNGVVTNLNSLIHSGSGLHVAYANAINNNGEIAGVAFDAQGQAHGVLLRPGDPGDPPPPPPPPPPVVPTISINDVSGNEGNKNSTTNFTFTVRLSQPTTATVSVGFTTANGTAIAGVDYNSTSGTLVFGPGETSKTVVVVVRGDRTREADETFTVNLSGAAGGTLADAQGAGTIRNDDR